ncbi:uncharacterized protein [Apostichopus japonicus]|uniref:uncharacterized protein n=1 Tax=Stichopus japonicus TaxID=307972 RepID=UPI003AB4F523
MSTLYVFVIIVTFSTSCSGYVVSHSETDRSIASVILKEGQSAEISCMTKGTGDYFWRKGETLYNSTLVASFTLGEVSDDSQPYSVTENGTLHIKSVTLKDEGNYFCRLSSTENECYGEVKILVQASLFNFDLTIDRCDRQSSCLLYLDPSQSTSMTCTALNAPPLMTLKWFNGSKEITEGIVQNEILPQNGNSREITSTVAAVYGRPASLTCQAVDPKRSNDDVRFAHAQVEMTVPFIETLPSWIIVSVTSAGCFIVFGIFLLIKAMVNRKQRKKYTKLKKEDADSLTMKVKTNEETINAKHQELTEFKVSAVSKDSELNELKGKLRQTEEELKKSRKETIELQVSAVSKDSELDELKGKLRQTEEELKKSRKENIELQTKTAKDEAKITYAEESAKTKDQEIANRDQELTNLKTKLQQKDEEMKKEKNKNLELQTKIANNETKITAAKESAKTKDQEIKNKNQELIDLKSKVPDQIQEMSTLKGDVRSKAKAIADLEGKLKKKEAEVKEKNNENVELQKTISNALANDKLMTTVNKKIVEQKDSEIKEQRKQILECQAKLMQREKEIKKAKDANIVLQTNLQRKGIASQGKSDDILKLKGYLTEKDNELEKIRKELDNLKEESTQKDHKLQDLYKESRNAERGSHRRQGKNEKGN